MLAANHMAALMQLHKNHGSYPVSSERKRSKSIFDLRDWQVLAVESEDSSMHFLFQLTWMLEITCIKAFPRYTQTMCSDSIQKLCSTETVELEVVQNTHGESLCMR
jgi:hypothetical protein